VFGTLGVALGKLFARAFGKLGTGAVCCLRGGGVSPVLSCGQGGFLLLCCRRRPGGRGGGILLRAKKQLAHNLLFLDGHVFQVSPMEHGFSAQLDAYSSCQKVS
jgi:hypothetical protein